MHIHIVPVIIEQFTVAIKQGSYLFHMLASY